MSDSIKVAIKVRPLIKREKDEGLPLLWTTNNDSLLLIDPEKRRVGESTFQFDHVFDHQINNEEIFQVVVKPIVDAAVNGFNGTVFAYGQTSSGKTYTMLGTSTEPGVIPMAIERIFDTISETCGREFLLRVSYLEIYNEKVNDLLDTEKSDLKLREDNNGLVQVINCKEEIASSPEVIMSIMKKGDKNRRIGDTDMNEKSSRSHTIFRITIESREQSSDSDGAIQVSQLNLVDLAGSERARQTNTSGERFKEGTHINMSLSTLGLVIKQLSDSTTTDKFISFRDSKLTRLLQASLGGNALTTIICAVTPAALEETLCTLSFASRAKSVKNKPQVNEVVSDTALLKRYKKQLLKLNNELGKLKNENGIVEMESKLQEKDKVIQMLEERIELLKNTIVSPGSSFTLIDRNTFVPKTKRRRTWAGDRLKNSRLSLSCNYGNLPTIEETSYSSLEDSNKITNRRRNSIIETVNLNEQSCETGFTDFELELIKVAKERNEDCVKFNDNVEIHRYDLEDNNSVSSDIMEQQNDKHQEPSSPGTPKSILRKKIYQLAKEYKELEEFTKLEKQLFFDEQLKSTDIELQKENDELKKKLDEKSAKLTSANELVKNLKCDCDCLMKKLLQKDNEVTKLKEKFHESEKKEQSNQSVQDVVATDNICMDEIQEKVSDTVENDNIVVEELNSKILSLEKDLQYKVQESNEIEKFITDLKQTLQILQQSIDTLTNENMDLSRQLTESRESNTHVVLDLQNKIDALTVDLTKAVEEKSSVTNELEILNEKFESMRSTTPVASDDDTKLKYLEYQDTIKNLTEENIALSTDLMEKIEELERIKESKVQEFDHQCTYRDKAEFLENENIELSNDLTGQIEENDKLKETVEELKKKIESYANRQSTENTDDELIMVKEQNEQLTNQVVELKTKITQLNRENDNLSINLNSSHDENDKKIIQLEEQIKNLTLMNEKLSELKLNSCSQCAQLKELFESRRRLKLELKSMHQKFGDLEKDFKRKCIETETLKTKANQDFNSSLLDSSLNSSINWDGLNVTGMEEKVLNYKGELEDLKENHNRLANQYQEKCNELEKLQIENNKNSSKSDVGGVCSTNKSVKITSRIQALEKSLDILSKELQDLKISYTNVHSSLDKLMLEKIEMETNVSMSKEKAALLQEELTDLYKRIEVLTAAEKDVQVKKLGVEVELDSVKSRIIEELKCLNNDDDSLTKELTNKPATDIFVTFLNVVMSKQTEILKKFQEDYKKSKLQLKEQLQQSVDSEKRANSWAKTLECENEKLQTDLTQEELKNKTLLDENCNVKHHLKEIQHENNQLRGTVSNLESDLNQIQRQLEKKSSENSALSSAAQEKDRQLARAKEEEWEMCLSRQKESHEREISKLNEQLDTYRSMSEDLKNSVEGLELEIEHFKNTLNIKSSDLENSRNKIEELERVILELEEINQQLKNETIEKEKSSAELSRLLKIKCDMLTEYKTKVETMKPEYDNMQAQFAERKITVEKLKQDMTTLKLDSQKQVDSLLDKLSNEEIKSAGLSKQISDLRNKNTQLYTTIEEFKDRCSEIERENANLQQKVRNSSSKIQVENEMQELQDTNRSLKNHLEGSYNRIKELQESKSDVQRELTVAQGKYELLSQELNTTKIALETLREKHNNENVQNLREKNEKLANEVQNSIYKIEEQSMLLAQKEQKLMECSIELKDLKNKNLEIQDKNKELDEEMDELVTLIHKLQGENSELTDKVVRNGMSNDDLDKIVKLEEEKEKLQLSVRAAEVNREQLENEIVRLRSDKDQLVEKLKDLNAKPNDSPTSRKKLLQSRERRSNSFNQSRNLDDVNDDCFGCNELRNRLRETSLEIVSKNNKIAMLEKQLGSKTYPYQAKYNDLQSEMMSIKVKNTDLKLEIQKLQRALIQDSTRECQICRWKKLNKRDQAVQAKIEPKVCMSGMPGSGVVEDYIKINKLEKEKEIMKNLCRSRSKRIKELEARITEFEGVGQSS